MPKAKHPGPKTVRSSVAKGSCGVILRHIGTQASRPRPMKAVALTHKTKSRGQLGDISSAKITTTIAPETNAHGIGPGMRVAPAAPTTQRTRRASSRIGNQRPAPQRAWVTATQPRTTTNMVTRIVILLA